MTEGIASSEQLEALRKVVDDEVNKAADIATAHVGSGWAWLVHDGAGWRGTWRIATEPQRTSDEYAVWLLALLGHSGLKRDDIEQAVIGTVVPAALYHLRRLVRDWFATYFGRFTGARQDAGPQCPRRPRSPASPAVVSAATNAPG